LRAPTPRPEQLVRPRLLELLGEAVERKVSLISAPAGYGKSTLLAQWLQAQDAGLAFAWISLDEQDNDPVRMWRHIVEALHRVAPEEEGLGADVLVGDLEPEAAYFVDVDGARGAHIVVEMEEASQIPPSVEPLILALGAEIEIHPVMVLEDLGKATPEFERVAQKYG
jgi:hypothetical protein